MTRLIVELKFDEIKIAEVERRLDSMSERQLRILIEYYKERVAKRDQAEMARQQYMLDVAKQDLANAQIYRDHLKREHQQRILQGNRESNLVMQNILNQNRFMYGNNMNRGTPGMGFY